LASATLTGSPGKATLAGTASTAGQPERAELAYLRGRHASRTPTGVRGGVLHIPQRHSGIQRRGDKRMPQRVRPDPLGDPGTTRDAADDPRALFRMWVPAG
jgi:hypothetical protein